MHHRDEGGVALADPLAQRAPGGEGQQRLYDLERPPAGLDPGVPPDVHSQPDVVEQVVAHQRPQAEQPQPQQHVARLAGGHVEHEQKDGEKEPGRAQVTLPDEEQQ